jgi:hypothetical protein
MRCEDARQAVQDARYGEPPSPDAALHVAGCAACAEFVQRAAALDSELARAQTESASAGFDARFFARLEHEKRGGKGRRYARAGWAILPLAAAFALLVSRHAPERAALASTPKQELSLAIDLELIRNIEVVSKLDELEAYDVLSELDEAELARVAQEAE